MTGWLQDSPSRYSHLWWAEAIGQLPENCEGLESRSMSRNTKVALHALAINT